MFYGLQGLLELHNGLYYIKIIKVYIIKVSILKMVEGLTWLKNLKIIRVWDLVLLLVFQLNILS